MIYRQFIINEATILVWEVTENEKDLENLLLNLDSYKSELDKLRSPKRRVEFLTSRIVINTVFNAVVKVLYDLNGKPFLENELAHISISHSKNWVAVIHHPTRKVGIDIECPTARINKIAHRFLNQIEQEDFSRNDQNKEVQLIWSAKEALYKIIGNEVADFATQLTIFPFKAAEKGTFTAIQNANESLFQMHYMVEDHYNLVFCIA